MTKSILLVGVGGQGTILASKLLTAGLLEAGYDVKMSEIHGMSQRGGSVSSQVRYGGKVEAPVIEVGGADMLVAFEKMEALRWLKYLKPEGKVVVNDFEIPSMPIITGKADYPAGIIEELSGRVRTTVIDAARQAEALGNPKVMNVILLGTIITAMNLKAIDWAKIIRDNVKPQLAELNIQALEVGMSLV
ncbi:indolepyruvate oxidoreductase subunit beta [Desulfitobacterium chlororespirans]|uniref:Indolepyruvate ferredoxin oxidoreductase beta subunit n=1 Tax=Desulfitobacterium chlororespirans DSM 11544 TaxID=1121395 RepID=A0A1M7S407_9FIRM|nr:indolepyruvate oxidoreductase subunit beta [Desulfitobacterium chlororespirans]SHN53228.1 indolepyruvate ferredoxin oxidoreductase beta subunit [Desulfitobacterium chlororespirans DSM 11544]